jgi:YbbR domain-containing protein
MKWFDRVREAAVWGRMRDALVDPERLRQALTRNFALKLLSLLIAFSLWFFVNFGERDSEESLKVPLELRNIPSHLMITSPRVDFIDLRVSGPRTLLGRIDRNRLSIGLDLNGVRPGPAVFRVDVASLNLPRGVQATRINPSQVTLEMERVGHKAVPVRLRLSGKPPADLQVGDTKVSPETVQVTGPASDVRDVAAVNTEPLDVSAATPGTIERELQLDAAGDYISFSANRVAAQVRIEEVLTTREFKSVPVEVRHAAAPYRLTPDRLRLSVRGPKRLLSNLELEPGAVYIDAGDVAVGQYTVKPSVELPPGVEVVSLDPVKVQLTLAKGRRSDGGRR